MESKPKYNTKQSEVVTPLPCPFCAEIKIVSMHQERSIVFKCSNCGAQTDDTLCHKTKEDALEKWNMRKRIHIRNKKDCTHPLYSILKSGDCADCGEYVGNY